MVLVVTLNRSTERLLPPTLHRARHGRRRSFLSERDARAYDEGYMAFQGGEEVPPPINTPRSQGWFDAEQRYVDRSDA